MLPNNCCCQVLTRWIHDLRRKELVPLKIMFAMVVGASYALYPFLTIHLKSLGITASETALIYAVLPLIACIAPPVIGIIADKFGHIKLIFSVTCVMTAITADCLLLVPPARVRENYQGVITWNFTCGSGQLDGHLISVSAHDKPCSIKQLKENDKITFDVLQCSSVCSHGSGDDWVWPEGNVCFDAASDSCRPIIRNSTGDSSNFTDLNWSLVGLERVTGKNVTTLEDGDADVYFQFSSVDLNGTTYPGFQCRPLSPSQKNCMTRCTGTLSGEDVCASKEIFHRSSFWIYLGIRVILQTFSAFIYVLFEAIALGAVKSHKTDYGWQKLWGAVAGCIIAPVSGVIIDSVSKDGARASYNSAFYIYAAGRVITAVVLPFLATEVRLPSHKLSKDIKGLIKNAHFDAFMAVALFTGVYWGYLESFLFWFLEDLGGKRSLMGLTVTVGQFTGLFVLLYAGEIIKRIGHVNVLIIGLSCYCLRFTGYSFLYDPYWCLPFETLEAFTSNLFLVAAVTYTGILAPPSALASAQGLLMGLYYGIGKGSGSLSGGYLIKFFGIRSSFRLMGGICGITAILYALVHHLILKRRFEMSTPGAPVAVEPEKSTPSSNGVLDMKTKTNSEKNQFTEENIDESNTDSRNNSYSHLDKETQPWTSVNMTEKNGSTKKGHESSPDHGIDNVAFSTEQSEPRRLQSDDDVLTVRV